MFVRIAMVLCFLSLFGMGMAFGQVTDGLKLTTGPEDKLEKVTPGKIDEDASAEFSTTDSGLKYRILRKTDGKKPAASDRVEVQYKGWLDNGKIFESSYRRESFLVPPRFLLDKVIPGWTEGIQLIGEGGMIELEIPPDLAYGSKGKGEIPPGATLHFLIELKSIR